MKVTWSLKAVASLQKLVTFIDGKWGNKQADKKF